ncbi:hypothetical protein MLD38_018909 [Melastoma candidum]|uniref:Uncharacterized protein n=1 Tax=Melastoma candidum TaxID=119954 RepID=A0ACB9R3J9_9MYRT|nr:hypothetical protein MLD38_018909 [Melastoma candidum]
MRGGSGNLGEDVDGLDIGLLIISAFCNSDVHHPWSMLALTSSSLTFSRSLNLWIVLRLIGSRCFWMYFNVPRMIETGDLPIKGEEGMDWTIHSMLGTETSLRCRGLPSFCRVADTSDPFLQ